MVLFYSYRSVPGKNMYLGNSKPLILPWHSFLMTCPSAVRYVGCARAQLAAARVL